MMPGSSYVPLRMPDTICVQDRLPPGAAAVLINPTHAYRDLVMPIDAQRSVCSMPSTGAAVSAPSWQQRPHPRKESRNSTWRARSLKGSGTTIRSCSTRRADVNEERSLSMSVIQETLTRFWDQLIAQPSGPLAFRFILQPAMAAVLAALDGLKDARTRPATLLANHLVRPLPAGLLPSRRAEKTQQSHRLCARDGRDLPVMVLRRFYLGEALVTVFVLAVLPYVLIRGPVHRIARRASLGSHPR